MHKTKSTMRGEEIATMFNRSCDAGSTPYSSLWLTYDSLDTIKQSLAITSKGDAAHYMDLSF